MNMTKLEGGVSPLAIAALAGLAMSACQPSGANAPQAAADPANAAMPAAALPLDTGTTAPAPAAAPGVDAMPAAAPAPIGGPPAEQYAYADQAQAMSSALGDAPPDYAVSAGDGQTPWVWQGEDRSLRVSEPVPGGADRYYYYAPGSETPYLVRDNGYSYGYQGGALVVVYDKYGRALPPADLAQRTQWAGRYLARARRLHQIALSERREAVAEANWVSRRQALAGERTRWERQVDADPAWRAYHDRQLRQEQAKWDLERYRRQAEAARFADQVHDRRAADQALAAARQTEARARAEGVWRADQAQQARRQQAAQQAQARQTQAAQQRRQDSRQAQLQAQAARQAEQQRLKGQADAARQQNLAAERQAADTARVKAQAQANARAQAEAERKARLEAARKAAQARADKAKAAPPATP